jgi:mono/diheme cytochrome c family protein
MRAVRILVFLASIASAAAAVGTLVQSAPAKAAKRLNPFDGDEKAQRAGGKLYARQCASCHGGNREGRRHAPPLIQPEVREAPSGTLFWVLRNGSLHRGMPSFAHLPEAQRWQIVTFLRTGLNRADGR